MSPPHALRFQLATNPAAPTHVLGVLHCTISGHLLRTSGLTPITCHAGAVMLIRRFGSALNLISHFHMLFLDGAYLTNEAGHPAFRQVPEPTTQDLQSLVDNIARRCGRTL